MLDDPPHPLPLLLVDAATGLAPHPLPLLLVDAATGLAPHPLPLLLVDAGADLPPHAPPPPSLETAGFAPHPLLLDDDEEMAGTGAPAGLLALDGPFELAPHPLPRPLDDDGAVVAAGAVVVDDKVCGTGSAAGATGRVPQPTGLDGAVVAGVDLRPQPAGGAGFDAGGRAGAEEADDTAGTCVGAPPARLASLNNFFRRSSMPRSFAVSSFVGLSFPDEAEALEAGVVEVPPDPDDDAAPASVSSVPSRLLRWVCVRVPDFIKGRSASLRAVDRICASTTLQYVMKQTV